MNPGSKDSSSTSRAEELRRRRAQQSQKRTNTVSSRVVNPTASRPVTVRGNAFGTPIHRQASTQARRQYYVTTDRSVGAELRLPALPTLHMGWRMLSGLIILLCAIGLFSVYNSTFFEVQTINVLGPQRVTPAEINEALGLGNTAIVEIVPEKIKEELAADFPELVDIRVDVALPNGVTVRAAERQPILAIQKGDQLSWVDEKGVIFPARGDAGSLITIHTEEDLPVIAATADEKTASDSPSAANTQDAQNQTSEGQNQIPITGPVAIDPALLAAAQDLSQKLSPDIKLVYSRQEGLGWVDPQGWQVFIGSNLNDFEEKYAMYQAIAQYLGNQGIRASLVSVENLNAPFYRLEQ